MVRLLLRLLMQRRHHAAYAAGYERGKQDGLQEGKRLAHARLLDLSRNEYPGAARVVQHFLRRSYL
ncbi:hypothetical protein LMG3458_02470 [Achromobacter deleyi]|uniref:Essential protein Yae1 N-terminal domain-containing protein n=1 Tax=Achromobacter deleyi TaxID=1353891 RepID=A0A6S6ZYV6_9BURK|nr:hypothetical protein LMG3458_02470 [Achromobacter deleyi]